MLEEAKRPDLMPNPLNNLGIVQRRLGNYARAQEYYEQSLKLYREAKNKHGASLALSNPAVLKLDAGDFSSALDHNRQSPALREELGNKQGVSISLNDIGNVFLEQNDLPQALEYYEKQLKITEEIKALDSTATALTSIAGVKLKMRQPNEALDSARRSAALWNLPFQGLQNPQNRFLLEDYVLSYAPSLTALREMRKIAASRAGKSGGENTLLAFGNPIFAAPDGDAPVGNAVLRGGDQMLAPLPDNELSDWLPQTIN